MAANEDNQGNRPVLSDWMKIMLEEIERKESEQDEAREELRRRNRPARGEPGKDDASTDPHG